MAARLLSERARSGVKASACYVELLTWPNACSVAHENLSRHPCLNEEHRSENSAFRRSCWLFFCCYFADAMGERRGIPPLTPAPGCFFCIYQRYQPASGEQETRSGAQLEDQRRVVGEAGEALLMGVADRAGARSHSNPTERRGRCGSRFLGC